MQIDTQTWIALGVGAHLAGALVKTLVHTPKQKAQIDAIESKVEAVLGQLQGGSRAGVRARRAGRRRRVGGGGGDG